MHARPHCETLGQIQSHFSNSASAADRDRRCYCLQNPSRDLPHASHYIRAQTWLRRLTSPFCRQTQPMDWKEAFNHVKKKALTLNFVLVCTCMYSLRGEFNSSTTFNNTKNVIFLEGHCVCGERLHTHRPFSAPSGMTQQESRP